MRYIEEHSCPKQHKMETTYITITYIIVEFNDINALMNQ